MISLHEPTLRLSAVAHRFGRQVLFGPIDLSLAQGEWLAVTGPNGSGKTTLVRVIAGLLRPIRGGVEIACGGRVLTGAERRNALGIVTPDLALDLELTARENLRFHAGMRDLAPGGEETLLDHVGLAARADDRVATFSSGMRQRLKYAFAIQHAPALLLLDEPTANLDAVGAAIVERIRTEQLARGMLVVATNDPAEASGATCTVHLGD